MTPSLLRTSLLRTSQAGSREFDAEIAQALGWTSIEENIGPSHTPRVMISWFVGDECQGYYPPAWSTDLSSAVALVENLLPGWEWCLFREADGSYGAQIFKAAGNTGLNEHTAPTAPLALLRALFFAKEAAQ